jgi:hypothetical protein
MIDRTARLSVGRPAKVLGIRRGSVCCKPRPVSDADLKPMNRIDKLHLKFPFAANRMLQGLLVQERFKAGRLHVVTLPLVTLLRNALPGCGWRGASSTWLPCWIGSAGASWHGECRLRWRPASA